MNPRVQNKLKRQGYICPWCGYSIPEIENRNCPVAPTIDHLIPKFKFGLKRPSVIAHRRCNNERGHNNSIGKNTLSAIQKSASQYGLTQDWKRAIQIRLDVIKRHMPSVDFNI